MSGSNSSPRDLKAGGSLHGRVRVPGDKSISHRSLLFGAIAEGITTIEGLLPAEDPISTAACLRSMGTTISPIQYGEVVDLGLSGYFSDYKIKLLGDDPSKLEDLSAETSNKFAWLPPQDVVDDTVSCFQRR